MDAVGRMDRRFLTTSVIPTVVFLTAYGAVAIASWSSFEEASNWLSARSAVELVILGLLSGALIWFLAGLMSSNWRKIVRLYEGYPIARWLNRGRKRRALDRYKLPGFAFHLEQKYRLSVSDANQFYFRYPLQHDEDTLPTTIGNILRAGERYGVDRYGFETNLLWTRFAWCLPESTTRSLEQFKEEHQLPLALSFTSFAFTVLSGASVIVAQGPPMVFAVATSVGLSLAIAAYLLSVERTEEYAEQLRSAVDLHHPKLRDVWVATIPDAELGDWFGDASAFVEGGHRRLEARRQERVATRRQPSAAESSSRATGASSSAATCTSRHGDELESLGPLGVIGPACEWIFSRIRLLWITAIVATVAIVAGTWHLSGAMTEVVIAAETVGVGEEITYRQVPARRASLPDGTLDQLSGGAIALRHLHAGEYLRRADVAAPSDLSVLTLPSGDARLIGGADIAHVIMWLFGSGRGRRSEREGWFVPAASGGGVVAEASVALVG